MLGVLKKEHVDRWVKEILNSYTVVAPTRLQGGDDIFGKIGTPGEIIWDYWNSFLPPKAFLFPFREPLFSYRKSPEEGWILTEMLKEEKTVILGIRPCDAVAIGYTDAFFGGNLPDAYYLTRRRNTYLFTLECFKPREICFCRDMGAGPYLPAGFDLQMSDLQDRFVVETGTPEGEALVGLLPEAFREAGPEEIEERERRRRAALEAFAGPELDLAGVGALLSDEGRIPQEFWRDLADCCLMCGGCSYVCPTCTCFNVVDLGAGKNSGERVRVWDSCAYGGFTRETSGYNPRPDQKSRCQRRFFHKLSERCRARNTTIGCVGCGRCSITCLGGLSMREIIGSLGDLARRPVPAPPA